jgi:hypothetical protein
MLPMQPVKSKAIGNAEVVALLKRWLERAEQGRIAFVGLVACEHTIHSMTDHGGHYQLAFAANWGFDLLKLQLQEKMASRHLVPEPADRANTDRVCYDVSKGPACYDFTSWLIMAEMNRRRAKAPFPLKVAFRMLDAPEEREKHARLRQQFYDGVIMPSLALVGAVEDDNSADAPTLERYTLGPIVEFAKAGEEVPFFTPTPDAVEAVGKYLEHTTGGQPPVTITLREAPFWEYRNSNLTEWLKVAAYLEEHGEKVIIIRDTANWDKPITGFETCNAAAVDLHVRTALYEAAKCNLFVSNGPWQLALFGTRPWLLFVELNAMSPFFPETNQFWVQWHGVSGDLKEQFPWSKPTQRITWKRDTYENIVEAWEKLKPLLDERPLSEAAE